MKSFLIIGLGRFGKHLAEKFYELGDEVMAIDLNEERVQNIMPIVTSAKIGNCTNPDTMKTLGVGNFDVCFVCTGSNFQNSLEITSLLKELGAKKVVSKAGSDVHAKFLQRNGADDVIYPERDSSFRVASRYSIDNVFNYIELSKDMAIYEIPVAESWIDKSISQIDVRKKYNLNILAIKENNKITALPTADYIFYGSEHIVILGRNQDVEKFMKRCKRLF
ncbi:MAG: TrkA family potassium uptake protein [Ruminococcus sp.]|nr:TrkA family potassium uptake protein [Ruminococcus sp.]